MSALNRDRVPSGDGPAPAPVDLPLALAMLAMHRDLIEQVQRITWALTAGDFEALVIWCELARHGGEEGGSRPLPLHDLVAATAIPRETVRRKLARLATLGHVTRVNRGWVVRSVPLDPTVRERARQAASQAYDAFGMRPSHAPAALPGPAAGLSA